MKTGKFGFDNLEHPLAKNRHSCDTFIRVFIETKNVDRRMERWNGKSI